MLSAATVKAAHGSGEGAGQMHCKLASSVTMQSQGQEVAAAGFQV